MILSHFLSFSIFLLASITTKRVVGIRMTFQGNEIVNLDLRKRTITSMSNQITFKFKTIHPTGTILFSSGTQGDYLNIDMIQGKLRYRADLGSTSLSSSKQILLLGDNLNDNKWHSVTILRNGRNVTMTIDYIMTSSYESHGIFTRLDLDTSLSIGGLTTLQSNEELKLSITTKNFVGCLENYLFDDINILYGVKYNQIGYHMIGDAYYDCKDIIYIPITFPSPSSHIKIPSYVTKSLDVMLNFRTHIPNGIILSKKSQDKNGGKIFIGIKKGRLFLEVKVATRTPILLETGNNLNDGIWHKVHVIVTKDIISLDLDKGPKLIKNNMWLKDIRYEAPYVILGSGAEEILSGFTGCIYDMRIDGTFIDFRLLDKSLIRGSLINVCSLRDYCLPNPCLHKGQCEQSWRGYTCDCLLVPYEGRTCEVPVFQENCQIYEKAGLVENSYCMIDPDGKGPISPIEVICNISSSFISSPSSLSSKSSSSSSSKLSSSSKSSSSLSSKSSSSSSLGTSSSLSSSSKSSPSSTSSSEKGVTTIIKTHQSMEWINVGSSQNILAGKYFHPVQYQDDIVAIEALIKRSISCRQYISYRCNGSLLLNSPRGPSHVEWVDRFGNMESYWGGAPKGSNKCQCGVKRQCADPMKYCNCDKMDNIIREDSGFLTDTSVLPVTMLQFHRSTANSYFMVGNLECLTDNTKIPTVTAKSALRACRPVIPKPFTTPGRTSSDPTSTTITKPKSKTAMTTTNIPKTINITLQTTTIKTVTTNHQVSITTKEKGGGDSNLKVNVTVGIRDKTTQKNALTVSMSIVAVVSISATIVIVALIIGVIVIIKRQRNRHRRPNRHGDDDDDEDGVTESHQMCSLFVTTRKDNNRPTIEIMQHKYRFESPGEFSGFNPPAKAHIDINYKKTKRPSGNTLFC